MSSSNQQNQTLAALGLSGNTRGAPKTLEVFALNTNDPFTHLQSAQLLQRSGADPILWTGTELTRSTPAGNFRLYKDASNVFGIWVPNSQAFYSDGIPPNISAPDILSGQMVGGSHADRTEPVRHYPAYGHSSDYRRNDRVFTNSNHRKNRATPYNRPAGYKQYQYSNTPSEQYNRYSPRSYNNYQRQNIGDGSGYYGGDNGPQYQGHGNGAENYSSGGESGVHYSGAQFLNNNLQWTQNKEWRGQWY
ncbi:unnamed protein product [Didymodactylos carnosus]|uniref:Uncharacterized protein n=1 Tax=Didymodactylos carnosus TaxID=1234261 RepID=A0A815AH83_9BILA|nr:unnamed protein product [Didymodactylos carnosus]CAF4028330.1 unnamed protein product [Didymodactylos carnosus]